MADAQSRKLTALDLESLPDRIMTLEGADAAGISRLVKELIATRERTLLLIEQMDESFDQRQHRDLVGSFAMRLLERSLRLRDEMF